MEKGPENREDSTLKKIVLTGPESTGKTTLAEQLANYYNTVWVTEYARDYVHNLHRSYEYHDLIHIAKRQIEQIGADYPDGRGFVFFDTGLIITKIWFTEVYQKSPDFLERAIREFRIDLFLLCSPDIPWKEDPVRENRDRNRDRLFTLYKNELEHHGLTYEIVRGKGEERMNNALQYLNPLSGKQQTRLKE